MKTELRSAPLRILVVEDVSSVRDELVDLLREELPAAQIEKASDVAGGRRLLDEAAERQAPFDFAILDLKLPKSLSDSPEPEPDTSLAEQIVRSFGTERTKILQWTGYANDGAIAGLQNDPTLKRLAFPYEVVSKYDENYPDKVLDYIDRHLPEVVIGTRLDDPALNAPPRGLVLKSSRRDKPDGRINVAGLAQAVVDYWDELSPARREDALRVFRNTEWELEESGDGVRVKSERSRRLLKEARENAEFFQQFSQKPPKR